MTATKYGSSQQELYNACRFAWNLCNTHRSIFAQYKGKYTEAFILQQLAEVEAADAMDDSTARYTTAQNLRIKLVEKKDEFMVLFNRLMGYITDAYQVSIADNMKKSAGQSVYRKANVENWSSMTGLLSAAIPFVNTHKADLCADNNMPTDFDVRLQAKKTEFEALYKSWNAADTAASTQTDEKITANNAIYGKMMAMLTDAKVAFPKNDPNAAKFVGTYIFAQIRGTKASGVMGKVSVGNTTGTAINNAKISIVSLNKSCVTDVEGRFDFSPIAAGVYTILIEAEGFDPFTIEAYEIKTGIIGRLNVVLTAVANRVLA